jgi:RNA polymerase primary sigma factor
MISACWLTQAEARKALTLILAKKKMNKLSFSFNDREQSIVKWRYGLDGPVLTYREAGKRLGGITMERARQIFAKADKKLYRTLRMQALIDRQPPFERNWEKRDITK